MPEPFSLTFIVDAKCPGYEVEDIFTSEDMENMLRVIYLPVKLSHLYAIKKIFAPLFLKHTNANLRLEFVYAYILSDKQIK